MAEELMALKDAQKYLGVSKAKMWRLAKGLTIYTDPLDKRKKLVPRAEIERLKQPEAIARPIESPPETKKPSSKKLWDRPMPFTSQPHEVKDPKS